MKLVENYTGTWFYHLSETGDNMKPALCGEDQVLSCKSPLDTWGFRGHLNERYCKKCEELAPPEIKAVILKKKKEK